MNPLLLISAATALDPEPQGSTAFSRLSKPAQDLIVKAAMGQALPSPSEIPDEVKQEILYWRDTVG